MPLTVWPEESKGFLYICGLNADNIMSNQQIVDVLTYSCFVLSIISVIYSGVTYFYIKRDLERRFKAKEKEFSAQKTS